MTLSPPKEEILELLADRLGPDGRGIGTVDGWEIHVPQLLPGERARVCIEHRSPHGKRAWAVIRERLGDPSPERVEPDCDAFDRCAGCVWQHCSYSSQLLHKREIVASALRAVGFDEIEVPTPLASPQTACYRNTGKYVFQRQGDGRLLMGAYAERSHEVVDTLPCTVVEPPIAALAPVICRLVDELNLPIANDQTGARGLRYCILRANDRGELLVGLVCHSQVASEALQVLTERIFERDEVIGVLRCDNDATHSVLLSDELTLLCGRARLEEAVGGTRVELGLKSFWQLNRSMARRAYDDIAQLLELPSEARVLELYCGVGGISLTLAERGLRGCEGIDSSGEAIESATRAAATLDGGGPTFRSGDARALSAGELQDYDAVIVDPPRKGLGADASRALGASGSERIAYLSCGPSTFARDARILCDTGYRLARLRLYDFMPHTAQVETLAIFERN